MNEASIEELKQLLSSSDVAGFSTSKRGWRTESLSARGNSCFYDRSSTKINALLSPPGSLDCNPDAIVKLSRWPLARYPRLRLS
jgi:hypothetical protein